MDHSESIFQPPTASIFFFGLIYLIIIDQVTDFLVTLQNDLPRVSPSSLESVFGQCMYFGLSFGRIGSDFRALLVPLFAQVAFDRFEQAANKAEAQFADAMASFSPSARSSGSALSSSHIQVKLINKFST